MSNHSKNEVIYNVLKKYLNRKSAPRYLSTMDANLHTALIRSVGELTVSEFGEILKENYEYFGFKFKAYSNDITVYY